MYAWYQVYINTKRGPYAHKMTDLLRSIYLVAFICLPSPTATPTRYLPQQCASTIPTPPPPLRTHRSVAPDA